MIGNVLQRLRKIYGYTGKKMSESLGISVSYLSEIENGHKPPSLELLGKYADIFEIKLSSLILLAENYEEAEKQNKGNAFIKKMMLGLINSLSSTISDDDEKSLQKI